MDVCKAPDLAKELSSNLDYLKASEKLGNHIDRKVVTSTEEHGFSVMENFYPGLSFTYCVTLGNCLDS
jgi:hypothetical protein